MLNALLVWRVALSIVLISFISPSASEFSVNLRSVKCSTKDRQQKYSKDKDLQKKKTLKNASHFQFPILVWLASRNSTRTLLPLAPVHNRRKQTAVLTL